MNKLFIGFNYNRLSNRTKQSYEFCKNSYEFCTTQSSNAAQKKRPTGRHQGKETDSPAAIYEDAA
jgi:hypothetical protein